MDLTGLFNKHKNKVMNIGIIIIALIVATNLYKKQLANTELLKVKISEEEKKNQILENIGQLDNKINSYRKLLVKREVSLVMSDISNLAKDTGVKIISIKPGEEEHLANYDKSIFDLTITVPNYDMLGGFINKVETYQNVYLVESTAIKGYSENNSDNKELTVNLRISSVAILK
ncbi:MAG: type 4a pilus biogenesis protein PilO [Candidatus Omnitrophica bacterium]|nr:type 4a pilus biogenesis protein PilO [Candidatus Omnitrophota bacterium]